jgi:DNA-binding MurR/RpiR family transcriptional regulator
MLDLSQYVIKNTRMATPPLFDRIRSEARSTAERKVASVLLEGYPTRALATVEVLAKQASVSAPTVLRFLTKIGFSRFADFQAAAIADVERQLGSPLNNIRSEASTETPDHIYQRTLLMQAEALQVAAAQAMPAEFDAIVDLLVSPGRRSNCWAGATARTSRSGWRRSLASCGPASSSPPHAGLRL